MSNPIEISKTMESLNEYELWRVQLDDYIIGLNFTYDNEILVVATSSGLLACYLAKTSTKLFEVNAHPKGLMCLQASPIETKIITTGQDGLIKLWDLTSNTLLKTINASHAWVEQAAWSPDGNYFAIGSGKSVTWFDKDGMEINKFETHESAVSGIAWKSNSSAFATSCYGGVRLFEINKQEPVEFLEWKNSMHSLSWSPDDMWIGCGTQDSRVHFFPLPYSYGTDFEMNGYKGKVKLLDWTNDAKFFLTNCWDELVIWQFEGKSPQGQEALILNGHLAKITQAKFQNKGSFLASGDELGFVHFYDAEIGNNLILGVKLKNTISNLCWSNNDKYMALGTSQGELVIMESPA